MATGAQIQAGGQEEGELIGLARGIIDMRTILGRPTRRSCISPILSSGSATSHPHRSAPRDPPPPPNRESGSHAFPTPRQSASRRTAGVVAELDATLDHLPDLGNIYQCPVRLARWRASE